MALAPTMVRLLAPLLARVTESCGAASFWRKKSFYSPEEWRLCTSSCATAAAPRPPLILAALQKEADQIGSTETTVIQSAMHESASCASALLVPPPLGCRLLPVPRAVRGPQQLAPGRGAPHRIRVPDGGQVAGKYIANGQRVSSASCVSIHASLLSTDVLIRDTIRYGQLAAGHHQVWLTHRE